MQGAPSIENEVAALMPLAISVRDALMKALEEEYENPFFLPAFDLSGVVRDWVEASHREP